MTMRDRLAADVVTVFRELGTRSDPTAKSDGWPAYVAHRDEAVVLLVSEIADRLIALGWVRLDEEALARALARMADDLTLPAYWSYYLADMAPWGDAANWQAPFAAAIIRALREEP